MPDSCSNSCELQVRISHVQSEDISDILTFTFSNFQIQNLQFLFLLLHPVYFIRHAVYKDDFG